MIGQSRPVISKMKTMRSILIFISIVFGIIVCSNVLYGQNVSDEQGRKQGEWTVKDKQGRIQYKGQFHDDIPYGTFTYYYKNGSIRAVSSIYQGGQNSFTKTYHENGTLMAEGKFVNREKDSIWNYYSDKPGNKLVAIEVYKNNSKDGVWTTFYPNGQVAEKITYQNGKQNGAWKQYFEDGSLKFKVDVSNGEKEGLFTAYYPGGVVSISGTYKNGNKNGTWMYFDENARKTKREVYENGIMVEAELFDEGQGQ